MTDAQLSIIDIEQAFNEYGSSITVSKVTNSVYYPDIGSLISDGINFLECATMLQCSDIMICSDGITNIQTKAIIGTFDITQLNENIHKDDVVFKFYTAQTIEYSDTITYNSIEYKIVNIKPKILQDTVIFYTVQGRA